MNSINDSRSRSTKPISKQKRILIIDEEDVVISFSRVLEQYGFKTDYFIDPVSAYSNFKGGQYDLVILDIKMPEIDGFHFYQKIKETDNRIKICFLTATEFFHEQIRKEHELGDFKEETFLRKPIEIENLVYSIEKLLKRD